MKFIADIMLGKLAKQMRLLGFDVLYERKAGDNEIIRLSLEQNRLILTRDAALSKRPLAAHHFFIKSDDPDKQLREVLRAFPPAGDVKPLTRCSECNEPLVDIARDQVQDLVPAHVYEKHNAFLYCSLCGRVYWRGTHVKRMASAEAKKTKNPHMP